MCVSADAFLPAPEVWAGGKHLFIGPRSELLLAPSCSCPDPLLSPGTSKLGFRAYFEYGVQASSNASRTHALPFVIATDARRFGLVNPSPAEPFFVKPLDEAPRNGVFRGLGALEGLTWQTAQLQVTTGDRLSPGAPLYCHYHVTSRFCWGSCSTFMRRQS
jgi:hypothetical protein